MGYPWVKCVFRTISLQNRAQLCCSWCTKIGNKRNKQDLETKRKTRKLRCLRPCGCDWYVTVFLLSSISLKHSSALSNEHEKVNWADLIWYAANFAPNVNFCPCASRLRLLHLFRSIRLCWKEKNIEERMYQTLFIRSPNCLPIYFVVHSACTGSDKTTESRFWESLG